MFCATNPNGECGRILVACNPLVTNFSSFSIDVGIFLEDLVRGHCQPISIINCYAPFSTWVDFLEWVSTSIFFNGGNVVLIGDLNLTL
jgi:hypothetical protein